jgi:hypothetical protein
MRGVVGIAGGSSCGERWWPPLPCTAGEPHRHLTDTSPTPHRHLTDTSPTPHRHLTDTSPTSSPTSSLTSSPTSGPTSGPDSSALGHSPHSAGERWHSSPLQAPRPIRSLRLTFDPRDELLRICRDGRNRVLVRRFFGPGSELAPEGSCTTSGLIQHLRGRGLLAR